MPEVNASSDYRGVWCSDPIGITIISGTSMRMIIMMSSTGLELRFEVSDIFISF